MKITLVLLGLLLTVGLFAEDVEETPKESVKETHTFQAEVSRLLDIIINSLYSNKEIFLREAISNSNDALDKLRFLSLENPELLKDEPELKVNIEVDKDRNMLILTDTGIGMTAQDMKNNLGTIARSGTTQFLEAITKSKNLNLIGQFGVGFYSYFLIANTVRVTSKSPTDSRQYIWESEAGSTFSIQEDLEGPFLTRGTKVEMILKKDAKEYLDITKVKSLTKKYSEFIEFPIYLYNSKQVSRDVEEEVTKEDAAEDANKDDLEIKDSAEEGQEKEKKTKKVTETVWDWEQVNEQKAIWKRSSESIEDEEYVQFYKAVTKEYSDPLTWIHFKAEGEIDFTSLLYIPKKAPKNLFQNPSNEKEKKSNLKLYVRKVLISDQFDDLLPKYLSFVSGVVDSDDLPLNVSRETLQQYRSVKLIKKKLTRKVLDQIIKFSQNKLKPKEKLDWDNMTEEEKEEVKAKREKSDQENKKLYSEFYEEFSRFLKHGSIEDVKNRDKIASLLRFPSTDDDSMTKTSFDDYISRMPEDQKEIFFIGGEDKVLLRNDPTVQGLVKRGYEVLLMDEPIDEYCMQNLVTYKDTNIANVTKSGFKAPKNEKEDSQLDRLKQFYKPLSEWLSKLFSSNVEKVELSMNTNDHPMVVLAGSFGYTANMQKLALNQPMANKKQTEEMLARMKTVVHINPSHTIIKEMLDRIKQTGPAQVETELKESAKLLFQVATINAGFRLFNQNEFVNNFHSMLSDSLGLDRGTKSIDLESDLADFEKLEAAKKEAEAAEKERVKKMQEEQAKLEAAKAETDGQPEDEVTVEDLPNSGNGEFDSGNEL